MITVKNETPDWPLIENVRERARLGTHLAPDGATDALFVDRGSGALGANQSALTVRSGPALLDGERVTIGGRTSVDIADGTRGLARRDVVYLTTDDSGAPAVKVREGLGGEFAWDSDLHEDKRTLANAERPAPPDMADTPGLVLAVVTVPANTTSLQTGAIDPIRVTAPAAVGSGVAEGIQTTLDGMVVPVAPGLSTADAIDPTKTPTPVQDAAEKVDAVGHVVGGYATGAGGILLPPGTIESTGNIRKLGGKQVVGWGVHASTIDITSGTNDGILVNRGSDGAGTWLDGFALTGGGTTRTSGSAFHFDHTGGLDAFRFDIGNLQINRWRSSDPVMFFEGTFPFSSNWGSITGRKYVSAPFMKTTPGGEIRGITIDNMFVAPDTPDEFAFDIRSDLIDMQIGNLNIGGRATRALHVDGWKPKSGGLKIDQLAVEPNSQQSISGGVVVLRGRPWVTIDNVSALGNGATADYGVELTGSNMFNHGPANNRIGHVGVSGNSSFRTARVGVTTAPDAPSWYWGSASDVDYGSHSKSAVVPMADIRPSAQ